MAKKRTKHDRLLAALKRVGTQVRETANSTVFSLPDRPNTFVFLGNADSVRIGRTKKASIPVSAKYKDKLLEMER